MTAERLVYKIFTSSVHLLFNQEGSTVGGASTFLLLGAARDARESGGFASVCLRFGRARLRTGRFEEGMTDLLSTAGSKSTVVVSGLFETSVGETVGWRELTESLMDVDKLPAIALRHEPR